MKNLIFVLITSFLFSSCGDKSSEAVIGGNDTVTEIAVNEQVAEEAVEKKPEPQPEEYRGTYLSDVKGKYKGPVLPESNIYTNEECGYKLTFPENWLGWYYIDDTNPSAIHIKFYGKSMLGTVWTKYLRDKWSEPDNEDYGLMMFHVLSEAEMIGGTYDNITYTGDANGIRYYYATDTDADLAQLTHVEDFWDDITEEEKQLAQQDWEKSQEMNWRDVKFEYLK